MGVAEVTWVTADVHRVSLGRGPLASNVYLVVVAGTWVLIDAGWASSAEAIRSAAKRVLGTDQPPTGILLTHIHPDHSGASGALARAWSAPVYAHPEELRFAAGRYLPEYTMPLDRWVVAPLMRLLPTRSRSRLEEAGDITDVIHPLTDEALVPGLPGWRWLHTPGHTPGHVAYLRPADMLLISGDAVLTVDLNSLSCLLRRPVRVSGPPRYTTWRWPTAMRSFTAVAGTRPQLLAPGHGEPLHRPFDPDRSSEHRRTMGSWPRG